MEKWLEFLKVHQILPELFEDVKKCPRWRYFKISLKKCIKMNIKEEEVLEILMKELDIPWKDIITLKGCLRSIYALNDKYLIAHSRMYREHYIHGMDVSSMIAVMLMKIKPTDHILDMCCAPGAKLGLMTEYLEDLSYKQGTITGVDITSHRLATCRTMMKQGAYESVRLFLEDARLFNIRPNSPIYVNKKKRKRKETNLYFSSWNYHNQLTITDELYDKVMVDAECTHDGSFRHVLKYLKDLEEAHDIFNIVDTIYTQEKDMKPKKDLFLDPNRLESLQSLQRDLLKNGFRLLKPGGLLLYVTCSLTQTQNEGIIESFLKEFSSSAHLLPIPEYATILQDLKCSFSSSERDSMIMTAKKSDSTSMYKYLSFLPVSTSSTLSVIHQSTLRLDPFSSFSSGLFIARVTKTPS